MVATLRDSDMEISCQQQSSADAPLFSSTGNRTVFPGVAFLTTHIQGERYLTANMAIPYLKQVTTSPLHLDGLINPVLSVGAVKVQLGTLAAPVEAVDLLAFALINERWATSELPLPITLAMFTRSGLRDSLTPQLALQGQNGDLYAVLQNTLRLNGDEFDALSVHSLSRGKLDLTLNSPAAPLIVNSIDAMDAATAQGKEAALVYRLDASDLRNLKLTPVPAAQIKVQSP